MSRFFFPTSISTANGIALVSSISATVLAGAGSMFFYSNAETTCEKKAAEPEVFRVEVHLMDRIQQKAYLESVKDGIPSTLRIMAIDLPEMRTQAFEGTCKLSHDGIFVEDIAPPKMVPVGENQAEEENKDDKRHDAKKKKQQKMKVIQKSLVKSLVHCKSPQSQQRVGVEMMEASVADLNPYQLRKTHQFGNFKYDPGKYYGKSDKKKGMIVVKEKNDDTDHGEFGPAEADEFILEQDQASFEDEMEAPWNQYAWAEELRLRINGQVEFGASMEKSSRWQRYLFGSVFKVTVPPVSRFWEYPLPQFARSDPNGVDGRNKTNCRACNKPHAVIANGAALQRVPSSLRLLQKLCRKADVPLFVIHDPRVWGGNTHQTLPAALKEMRSTIKNRVIREALKQQGSSAFTRGRMLGQAETEAKWQLKEKSRKTRKLFGLDDSERKRKSASPKDWSQLDATLLEKKLVERGVVQKSKTDDHKTYSDAMVEIAKQCIKDVDQEAIEKAIERIDISPEPENPGTASTVSA